MPPLQWAMLASTPRRHDDGTASLAGLRDHVLILVGFVGDLRRSEFAPIDAEHPEPDKNGLVLASPSCSQRPSLPADAPSPRIRARRTTAAIEQGLLLRGSTRAAKPRGTRISESSINMIVELASPAQAPTRPRTAPGLRDGFVTHANLMGQSDRFIARQTRHQSLASRAVYAQTTRVDQQRRRRVA